MYGDVSDTDSQATAEGGVNVDSVDNSILSCKTPEKKIWMEKKKSSENNKKPRKTMSKIVTGKAITNDVLYEMKKKTGMWIK